MKNIMLILIPIIVPLIIEFLKKLLPIIEQFLKAKKLLWLYPLIAAAIGILIDFLAGIGSGATVSAIAGAAGVGVYDAAKNLNAMRK